MTPEQARALFNEHREPGDLAHYGEKAAVAAIMEATQSVKAEDWIAVPREPTDAMINACQDNLYSQNPSWNDPREIWSAMLATAPARPYD